MKIQQQILPLSDLQTQLPNFIVGDCNQVAYDFLLGNQNWISPFCWLHGENGCGKTLLARYWQNNVCAKTIDLFKFEPTNQFENAYYLIDNLPTFNMLHETFFHLLNMVQHTNSHLLICSTLTPAQYPTSLNDLASRLRSANLLHINAPDDATLKAVMLEHLRLKQLKVEVPVIDYLLKRINRSCSEAIELLNYLDDYSLQYQQEITINLVRTAMSW